MSDPFIDLETGELGYSLSNDMLMNADGNLMMKMSDSMAMDLDSGELHLISSFGSTRFDDDD